MSKDTGKLDLPDQYNVKLAGPRKSAQSVLSSLSTSRSANPNITGPRSRSRSVEALQGEENDRKSEPMDHTTDQPSSSQKDRAAFGNFRTLYVQKSSQQIYATFAQSNTPQNSLQFGGERQSHTNSPKLHSFRPKRKSQNRPITGDYADLEMSTRLSDPTPIISSEDALLSEPMLEPDLDSISDPLDDKHSPMFLVRSMPIGPQPTQTDPSINSSPPKLRLKERDRGQLQSPPSHSSSIGMKGVLRRLSTGRIRDMQKIDTMMDTYHKMATEQKKAGLHHNETEDETTEDDWQVVKHEPQWDVERQPDLTGLGGHPRHPFIQATIAERVLADFADLMRRIYFVLAILGCINALLTFAISAAAGEAWTFMLWIHQVEAIPEWLAFFVELAFKVVLVVGAIFVTTTFSPASAGSGVGQLRAILSGIWIREYLGIKTLIVKVIALILSLGAGLPIGLEGPFIHISAIVGRQLTKLSWFQHLDRKQVLSAACAGGLGSVFGAPIGGVLFSIEVTSTYYPVSNYWTAFCCAVAGSTLTHVVQTLSPTSLLLYQTNFSEINDPFQPSELVIFAGMGIFGGLFGAVLIRAHESFVHMRRKYQPQIFGANPYTIAVTFVIVFVTALFFIGDFAIEPARRSVADMFRIERLEECSDETSASYDDCKYHDWNSRSLALNLALFVIVNFFFTVSAVTFDYPCGIFAPVFTLGAVWGRFTGEIFRDIFNDLEGLTPDSRVYAVVGAACTTASVTGTISPAVIALEITGELNIAVPLLLSVILACGVSSACGDNFYNSVLKLRGIPMLPIRPSQLYKKTTVRRTASMSTLRGRSLRGGLEENTKSQIMYRLLIADDVMDSDFYSVTIEPTADELVRLLNRNPETELFPVVHSRSEPVLIAEVRRTTLMDYLRLIAPEIFENDIAAAMRAAHVPGRDFDFNMDPSENMLSLASAQIEINPDTVDSNGNESYKTGEEASVISAVGSTIRSVLSGRKEASTTAAVVVTTDKDDITMDDEESELEKQYTSSPDIGDDELIDAMSPDGVRHSLMSVNFFPRLNLSPMQVISEMPLTKVYILFHILRPQNIYVTKYSRLIGVITEMHLLQLERQHRLIAEQQNTKCCRVRSSCCC